MTNRERVIKALNHVETDFVPYHAESTLDLEDKLVKHFGHNIIKDYNLHLEYEQYWGYPTEIPTRPGYFLDDFGVTWNRTGADRDIGVIDAKIITEPDIAQYRQPYLDEKRIREQCQRIANGNGGNFKIFGLGFSMFERFWSYCGMEDAFVYMVSEPEFVHALLDKICDFNLKVIDIANEYELDGLYFGDDWGSQIGLMMGYPLWKEFIKPRMARMYARAKKNGKYILQHSCGNVEETFNDLIEIGLNCYQTFQPEIYDIERIKRQYGDKLCFWGGISTQQLLPYAAPEVVASEVRRITAIMKRGGGYILAPTHAMPHDIPPQNVKAMLDAFENQ